MENSLQEFLAGAAEKGAKDLAAAVERLPEDKRDWSAMGDARSALNQAAECAILNGSTARLIEIRTWDGAFAADFPRQRDELAKDWSAVLAMLAENTPKLASAIRALSSDDLAAEVGTPFGTMTLAQIASYPFWNMSYHEGQINYIASMLGCLP